MQVIEQDDIQLVIVPVATPNQARHHPNWVHLKNHQTILNCKWKEWS